MTANWVPDSKYLTVSVEDTAWGYRRSTFPRFLTCSLLRGKVERAWASLVQRIIYEHQGFLEVDSTPGKGSCFWIRLPVATSQE